MAKDRPAPAGSPATGRRRPMVGREIKRWRTARELTLARVAADTGLNVGYLSQVENDKASPSLETLAALADALEVPIAWFLHESVPRPQLVRASERHTWSGLGEGRFERVDGGVSRELSIVEARTGAGFQTGDHAHEGEEHHLVLEGRFRFRQGDHTVEAGPGDYVHLDGTVPHDVALVGGGPGRMLIVTQRDSGSELVNPPRGSSSAKGGARPVRAKKGS